MDERCQQIRTPAQRTSTWRDKYKVHPAADVFPMMSDDELAELGEDIKANGLKSRSPSGTRQGNASLTVLIDGRNRMEAMERVGIDLAAYAPFTCGPYSGKEHKKFIDGDPVAYIFGLNIHRRHLTKQQHADLIVAAHRATPVSRQEAETREGRPVNR